MNHSLNRSLTIVTLLVVLAMAFGACTPTPTATPMPAKPAATVAPTVTVAPVSTSTPLPTATAIPTSTVTPPPTADPTPGPGSTQVSDKDGMTLLYVPAGDFKMGTASSDLSVDTDEQPQHSVYLDAFWIDQTEVTNALFKKFIDATGYQTDADKKGSGWVFDAATKAWYDTKGTDWQHPRGPSSNLNGLTNHPVVQVSWNDAQAYCHWAERRLPTEAEWEKAAHGPSTGSGDDRIYPWGNQLPDQTRLNYNQAVDGTTPVGNYPTGATPYGALDMAGNVWEWVADWYDENYYANSPSRNPAGPTSGDFHVLRGGSWSYPGSSARVSNRFSDSPYENWDGGGGFRCAR